MFNFLKSLFATLKTNRSLGAEPNPLDLRDIQLATFQKPVEVPYEYITDISMIPVTDQKGYGTCVGQAEGTILALYDFYENKNVDISRRHIYAKSKKIDGIPDSQGTYPRVASSIISKSGATTSKMLPDDNNLPYAEYLTINETAPLLEDAKKRRANYASVAINASALKQAIYQNKAISISLYVDWDAWRQPKLTAPKNFVGLHRVVLYGFKGDTFFARNSWSAGWGDNGNFSFDFADYANFMIDALAYTDIPNEILKDATDKDFIFTKVMRIGMSGPEVKKLQEFLSVTPTTGYFGPYTKNAVMRFQQLNKLNPDGIVGPKTLEKLNKPIYMLTTLEMAIMKVESGGDLYAVGDKTLVNKAYGPMQIRQGVCDDVNSILGTKIKAEQMLGNLNLSIFVFREHQKKWNPNGTDEAKAKTWNGGPGWKQRIGNPQYATYNKNLDRYWSEVKKLL